LAEVIINANNGLINANNSFICALGPEDTELLVGWAMLPSYVKVFVLLYGEQGWYVILRQSGLPPPSARGAATRIRGWRHRVH
jgi:hypothetical protein